METEKALNKASDLLSTWAVQTSNPEPNRLDVIIEPKNIRPAVKALTKGKWGFFSAMTGIDQPPTTEGEEPKEGRIEVLYHFCSGAAVVSIRTSVPYSAPVLDSICEILPSATLYERELMEMFGVELPGTLSTERLLLSDDWPADVYPLRKSFTGFGQTVEEETGGSTT